MSAGSIELIVSLLNHLIETCKDGEKGYRKASEEISHAYYRMLFNEFARQRSQFAVQLQGYVRTLNAEPDRKGSMAGVFHRGWMGIKSRVPGRGDDAVIAECERGEEAAVKNYQHALGLDLPSDLREIIEKQYREIKVTLEHIRAMRSS